MSDTVNDDTSLAAVSDGAGTGVTSSSDRKGVGEKGVSDDEQKTNVADAEDVRVDVEDAEEQNAPDASVGDTLESPQVEAKKEETKEETKEVTKETKVHFSSPEVCEAWDGRNVDKYVDSLLKNSSKQSFSKLLLSVFEMCSNAGAQKRNVLEQCPNVLEALTNKQYSNSSQHATVMKTLVQSLREILSTDIRSQNIAHWCLFLGQLIKVMSMEKKMTGEEKKKIADAIMKYAFKMFRLPPALQIIVRVTMEQLIDGHVFGKKLGRWKGLSWLRKMFCACANPVPNMQV